MEPLGIVGRVAEHYVGRAPRLFGVTLDAAFNESQRVHGNSCT
jgi:hypothetical protein